ncbi:MAG: hypothetical protein HC883_04820 [Bdellovibrionaceae bacterium]|nr:hypothetical protein [Pseudobdellovibrionaceae bacterium]
MKTPINVQDIWEFIPHRPPMVWIDQIHDFGASHGECSVRIKADAHYMGRDGLRASSCLEFIAQAYGFISICHREATNEPVNQTPRRAFLASFKDAKFGEQDLLKSIQPGEVLSVKVSGARQMGPIILFQGQVRAALICCAKAK